MPLDHPDRRAGSGLISWVPGAAGASASYFVPCELSQKRRLVAAMAVC